MMGLQRNTEESLKRIICKLRFCREHAGLSQKQTAEKLCVGYRSYQRIEGGETSVDISFLLRFSQLFDVNFIELVTPYAPVAQELSLYNSLEEILIFNNLPFIKESSFKDWAKRFPDQIPQLIESEEFIFSSQPMFMWSRSKKIMNESMQSFFDGQMNSNKTNADFFKHDLQINYLDNLLFHRPKYSLKKIRGLWNKEESCEVELYSVHSYIGDEILSFSFLRIL